MSEHQTRNGRMMSMFNNGYVVLPGMITVTPKLLRKLNLRLKSRAATRIKRTTLVLSTGDAVVFRADCVHAGSAYSQNNIRLHCYLDIPSMLHSKNRVTQLKDMSSTVVLENE